MVNILKHRKINKNPFVKFLKEFYEQDSKAILELKETEGALNIWLGNGRTVVIEDGFLYLVNYEYYSLGCFKIPVEELTYTSGTIYFTVNPENEDLKHDFQLFFSSKKEAYEGISNFDSIENEHKFKEYLLVMQEVGLYKQKLNLG